jgi:hypothetical protein
LPAIAFLASPATSYVTGAVLDATAATTREPEPLPRAPKDITLSGRAPPTTRECVDTPQQVRVVTV